MTITCPCLRPLPQAIRCKLHGVCPPDGEEVWPENSSDYFEELLNVEDAVTIIAAVVPGKGAGHRVPLPVHVKIGKKDIAAAMVAKGKGATIQQEVVMPCDEGTTPPPTNMPAESPISQLSSSSIPTPPPSESPAVATPPPSDSPAVATPPSSESPTPLPSESPAMAIPSQSPIAKPLFATDPLATPTSPPAALPSPSPDVTIATPLFFPPRELPAVGDVLVCKVVHVFSPR